MGRYLGPQCKLCRSEGEKLFLKGERCLTDKCAMERRAYLPGGHGKRRLKESEYRLQLREKQKTKRVYCLLEKQFKNYYELAARRKGITGENLLQILELRLDNVIYRLGFAFSRNEARQFVGHGFFAINGRRVDIPSYRVRPGEVITLTEAGKKVARIEENVKSSSKAKVPTWLEVDYNNYVGKVLTVPTRDQIDTPVREQLIVELYSK